MNSLPNPAVRTKNNFDLIRLCAALQVAIAHTAGWMQIPAHWLELLGYFPGVPVFFFISGYLIYQSYANIHTADRLKVFLTNRVLRLYPALFVCTIFAMLLAFKSGYFLSHEVSVSQFFSWFFAQTTILQFYNPDFLRDYATGKLNASLWTISVELQFYILTPIIFLLFNTHKKVAGLLFALFVAFNTGNSLLNPRISTLEKLFNVSFVPWIAMFALGAYLSTNRALQARLLRINILIPLCLYLLSYYAAQHWTLGTDNSINFISFVLLAWLILKAAFCAPGLSEALLRKNDFSYGIYIYHMPIVNFMLYKEMSGTYGYLSIALALTLGMAILSWLLVEKPALRLKKISLRRLT